MSTLLERLKKAEAQVQSNEEVGKIKLDKEYKFRLNDGKVHEFVPVQTYNGGRYIGVIVDNEKYAIISKDKFEKLIEQNKGLNKNINEPSKEQNEVKESHDRTENKQEKAHRQNRSNDMVYTSIIIYDTSDDGDRYMGTSIPVMMDSRGNIYHTNGKAFSRQTEELELDLKNDTGIFYEDWMHARGEPISYADKVADGIEADVASKSAEGQKISGLHALREEVNKETTRFSTKNYTDKEIEEAMEEMDITKDVRWNTN